MTEETITSACPAEAAGGALFSLEFISLNLAVFFGFCNLAMFYGFYGYLARIGVPAEWRGFLVGLEPLAAFVLRLFLIPFLHVGNCFRAMLLSLCLIVVSLWGYSIALTVPSLAALRILHGAGFVLLVSSATVLLVALIPQGRSGQAFAMMSIAWLVPYAVMPAVFDIAAKYVASEAHIYAMATVLAIPGIVLLVATRRRIEAGVARSDAPPKPPLFACVRAFSQPGIRVLLVLCFTLFFCNTSVFFFMQTFMARSGYGNAGVFFTISTATVILSRAAVGRLLDKAGKLHMVLIFVPLLTGCLVLFSRVHSLALMWALGVVFGLCLGVLFPVLNAAMFLSSPPHLRGANANVVQLVMDAGYFASPPVAGALLAHGYPPGRLFDLCAALVAAGFVILLLFRWLASGARAALVFDAERRAA